MLQRIAGPYDGSGGSGRPQHRAVLHRQPGPLLRGDVLRPRALQRNPRQLPSRAERPRANRRIHSHRAWNPQLQQRNRVPARHAVAERSPVERRRGEHSASQEIQSPKKQHRPNFPRLQPNRARRDAHARVAQHAEQLQ